MIVLIIRVGRANKQKVWKTVYFINDNANLQAYKQYEIYRKISTTNILLGLLYCHIGQLK